MYIYPVSNAFLNAIKGENIQHIRGELINVSGEKIEITDMLCGEILTESQCVTDSGQFGFGGMYVGTMECTLNLPDSSMKNELKGGTISLDFGVETPEIEWIPLGIWNINSCERNENNKIKLSCMDNLSKLMVSTEDKEKKFIGVVKPITLMNHVAKLTGVKFAQNVSQLEELSGLNFDSFWSTHYGSTAWEEVKSMAQIMGCFAFANREGKIEFRRLDSTTPALKITADERHSAKLEEYLYTVRSVKYTDSTGFTAEKAISGARSDGGSPGFSECLFVWESDNKSQYDYYLENISSNLTRVEFTPGVISYYGNPALDIGDYVEISGGTAIVPEHTSFLICCNSWQFRGQQTLTACGFPENGAENSGNISNETHQIQNINIEKTIKYITADTALGELFETERTAASILFSCRNTTAVFLEFSVIFTALETGNAQLKIYIDDVLQDFKPVCTVREGEYITQHFSLPMTVLGGTHSVGINALGTGRIEELSGYVWGQSLAEISPEETNSSDYIYKISNNSVEILYYIGESIYPEVPSKIENTNTINIESTAFNYSDVIGVYIPDGVEEIN